MQFPELNPSWILLGEGEMLRETKMLDEEIKKPIGTPIYDVDVSEHDQRMFVQENIYGYISLPFINRNAAIITVAGDSMKPIINSGDKIAVREVKNWDYLFYGQMYFIITKEYRMIKYVRKHPVNSAFLILHSENENYDDIELPKDQIIRLFVIENIISIKNVL